MWLKNDVTAAQQNTGAARRKPRRGTAARAQCAANTPDCPMPTALPWPCPRWIAHRGAGRLAPENTLAAFRLGAAHGYRMFECDVKLSADGVPFLLHDTTLARTTNAAEALPAGASLQAGDHPWATLSQFDAGGWHSPGHAGEPPASLAAVARFCRANGLGLNLELKPSPGQARHTGAVVAQAVAGLWPEPDGPVPLLTSFETEALRGAGEAVPALPRGLLLDRLWPGWEDAARALGCAAVVCQHALWDTDSVARAQALGCRLLSYTVNDRATAQRLRALGVQGLITDRVDLFHPDGED